MAIPEEILAKLRRNDPNIVGLDLSRHVQSDADVKLLVDALRNNTYLRTLTIQGVYKSRSISDESARLLSTCSHLVFLDLSFNADITDDGAGAFVEHLCLETLFFRGCSVTSAGLVPFLKNDVLTDLRIAISASPREQVGESVTLKLKENAALTLEQKLSPLTADQLNIKLCQFIHRFSFCIPRLPPALQEDAIKNPLQWEDSITTGFILSRNIAKLKGENMEKIVASAEIFVQRYMEIQDEQQKETKRAKVEREMSPSLSPPPSQPSSGSSLTPLSQAALSLSL